MNVTHTARALALAALSSCAPTSSAQDGSITDGAPTDAARDPDASCAQPAPVAEIAWTNGEAFLRASDHHATWVSERPEGASLYVAGGIRQGPGEMLEAVYNQVARAEILADGALGPWREDTPLPVPTGFHSVAMVDGRVYIAAGLTSAGDGSVAPSRRTFIGERTAEGALAWREGPAVPWTALHPTLTAVNRRLFLTGGTDGRSAQSLVATADVRADGSLSDWTRAVALPGARSHHVAFVHNQQLFLAGGFSGMPVGNRTTPIPEVLRAAVDANGAVTGWETVGLMDPVRYTHSAFVRDRWLYLVGGLYESGALAVVQRSPIQCDATLGAPEEVRGALPVARGHVHQTPVFNDRVYSVAGRDALGVSIRAVFVGALR
jgi:hypothetical protein